MGSIYKHTQKALIPQTPSPYNVTCIVTCIVPTVEDTKTQRIQCPPFSKLRLAILGNRAKETHYALVNTEHLLLLT